MDLSFSLTSEITSQKGQSPEHEVFLFLENGQVLFPGFRMRRWKTALL